MKILLVSVLLLAAAAPAAFQNNDATIIGNDNATDYKLPNNSVPISYTINLIPYIVVGNFTYDGESTIEIEVLESSSSITLHALALIIDEDSTSLVSSSNTNYEIANHTYDTVRQFLILNFTSDLPAGYYTLYLKYVGVLGEHSLAGFYRSSYINENGETVWLAPTQFEAILARRAFPCWDEPALKATFTISIKHHVNYTALSNMPIASQSEIDTTDNKLWTTFETTPIMSTYLVAFVVSDYEHVSNVDETFSVWTRPNALNATDYALTLGQSALAYIEEYTWIPYALPKMDLISVSEALFSPMENWGLIIFPESELLHQPDVDTTFTKQNIAVTVVHELVHQWFGNLVSPASWKYVWLNEGFATYFQYYFTGEIEDSWRMMEQFIVREIQPNAFVLDSSLATHPLNQEATTPDEIALIFDFICYYKGAAVINMMSNFLTPDVFRAGLIKYLNNQAYGVATTDDLWRALQEASDESEDSPTPVSIKTIMDPWVEQPGYPVLNVTRNYSTGTAVISQERFSQFRITDNGTRWWIPISYTTELDLDFSSTLPSAWIPQESDNITISGFEPTNWVIFNIQHFGYYRVNYDERNWQLLAAYLDSENFTNIHPLNRAQLIDSSYMLAHANRTSFSTFLNISVFLRRETDYIVWKAMITSVFDLYLRLVNTESYPLLKKYVVELLEYSLITFGYEESDEDEEVDKYQRLNAIAWTCLMGSEECKSNSTARVIAYLEDPIANPVSADLALEIFCAGLRDANSTIWNKVLDLYVQNPSTTILNYLGCSEDEEILDNYLTLASTANSSILESDSLAAYKSVYYVSPDNINFALDYFINNFERLYAFWNTSTDEITTILTDLSEMITTEEQLDKMKALVEDQSDLLGSTGDSAVATAQTKVEWADTYGPIFYEWLNDFYEG